MPPKQEEDDPEFSMLLKQIAVCQRCRDEPIGATLPHEPRPILRAANSARLCVARQAPGARVHRSGVPFTDPSGDRLRDWMAIYPSDFYDESQVAIVPMGFCFPGYNKSGSDLPPRRECALAWHDRLFGRLAQLRLVLAIGSYAHSYHLGDLAAGGVTETVRNWRAVLASASARKGLPVFPLPHPS